jgi:hypothetical protein
MPATPGGSTPQPSATAASPSATPQPGVAVIPGGPGGGSGGTPNGGPDGPGAPAPGEPAGGPTSPTAAGLPARDSFPGLLILGATISTVISLVVAFLVLGRRRRREDEEDAPLMPAPAVAAAAAAAATPMPLGVDPGTGGTDVDLPRWRRPSLMAARKSDPIRIAPLAASLTFAQVPGAAGAAAGVERRLVRYRIVRLLDRPDEIVGATVGSLDEGDEVEVLEKHGMYRRVQAPDGRTGWLHKMTLGDLVEEAEPEPEIEKDVLLAYLSGRGKG